MTRIIVKIVSNSLWERVLRWKFKNAPDNPVWVWGNTIYAPGGISPDLYEHESTHCRQQDGSKLKGIVWWYRYFTDKMFRYRQELEAYANQLKALIRPVKNREQRSQLKRDFAVILSGPWYNYMVTFNDAYQDLNRFVK